MTKPPLFPFAHKKILQTAMPLGGIGAGCICLNGYGGLQDYSIRNRPAITALPDGHEHGGMPGLRCCTSKEPRRSHGCLKGLCLSKRSTTRGCRPRDTGTVAMKGFPASAGATLKADIHLAGSSCPIPQSRWKFGSRDGARLFRWTKRLPVFRARFWNTP